MRKDVDLKNIDTQRLIILVLTGSYLAFSFAGCLIAAIMGR